MQYFEKSEMVTQAILDNVVLAYAATSNALPARRVLGYAGMPFDCDGLYVLVARVFSVQQSTGPDTEGNQVLRCVLWRGADVDVVLLRCAPEPNVTRETIQPIPVAKVEAFSKLLMADPHIIGRGVLDAIGSGALGQGANVTFMDTAPVADESGGLVGIRARFRVGLVVAL